MHSVTHGVTNFVLVATVVTSHEIEVGFLELTQ